MAKVFALNAKMPDFSSKFQYFLDERGYWNAPFVKRLPKSGIREKGSRFSSSGRIIAGFLPFVKNPVLRLVLRSRGVREGMPSRLLSLEGSQGRSSGEPGSR